MSERFPLKRSAAVKMLLWPFAPRGGEVVVGTEGVSVRFGVLGRAEVPYSAIRAVGRTRWPWWGGLGVRASRQVVAFAGSGGEAVTIDVTDDLDVRAPLRWTVRRVVLVVDDPHRLAAAIAAAGDGRPAAASSHDDPGAV